MSDKSLPGDPYDDCDGCQRLLYEKRTLEAENAALREQVRLWDREVHETNKRVLALEEIVRRAKSAGYVPT